MCNEKTGRTWDVNLYNTFKQICAFLDIRNSKSIKNQSGKSPKNTDKRVEFETAPST